VDFELSSEQEDLRRAAEAVLEGHASSAQVRAFVGREEPVPAAGDFDRSLWAALVDQGWPAIEQPEVEGGLGLGMVEVSLLCEQLGRAVAPAPFVGTVLAAGACRSAAGDPDLPGETREACAAWAAGLATGELVGTVAWSGAAVVSEGERAADGTCTLGVSTEPTVFGSVSDVVVVATFDAVYALGLPPAHRPRPEPAMDRTRSVAWLDLDHTVVRHIGGATAAAHLVDRMSTALAAEMLGAAGRALDMTVQYAKDRVQFGQPIGSFQAVKHRLADALVDVEGMRSNVYYAAWCLASGAPGSSLAASAAKAWCSDASRRVMASALQVHGGIGFTWEHDLHLYVKRAQHDQHNWGDAAYHRERVASFLAGRTADDPSLF
jgi:alkylation response protein AidB-like acyl-CoA dehydrogenase